MVGAPVKPTGPLTPPVPQKARPATPEREGKPAKRNGRPGLVVRIVISLIIVWHFTGVFLAALSIDGSSPLVSTIAQSWMRWYLDALYLNQGHSFFAPDVGPAHVIRYELQDQSGRAIESGELPNRKLDWPRLYYHRHFMLAEQSELPFENKQLHDTWIRNYLQAYGRHLLRENPSAQSIRLQRIIHWPLPRALAEKGASMTDPQGYEVQMDVVVRRSELGPEDATPPPPPPQQTFNWQNSRPNVANRGMGVPR